jgi:hypothetical protein
MNILMLIFLSCFGDSTLTHEVEKIVYKDREVIVEVEKQVEIPIVVIKEVEVLIEDTDDDAADVWVEHFTQPMSVNGVDILWVIDPSGSMYNDKPQILDGIADMMSMLPAADWRLAIISSDHRWSENENQFPLIPGDTAADAEAMYNAAVIGAFEAGFDATYGYIMNNPYAQTWLRHDAALLVVFVSDENEQSQIYFSATNEFTQWYSNLRQSVFLASIVNFDPTVSLCSASSASNTGTEYMDATNYFGGQIIDICDEDWSSGVADASNQTSPYEYWDLAKTPLYEDRIYVFVDGAEVKETDGVDIFWHYVASENRIYFDKVPDGGTLVEVAYYYE